MEKPESGTVNSPEKIHRALRVINATSWTPLIVLGGLLVSVVGFLVFGRIPITGAGNAMFLTRETVIPFQVKASGQIGKWQVKVGDRVAKGQLLAVLEQPLIKKQLEQARQKLTEIEERNAAIRSLSEEYTRLETKSIQSKREMLANRIAVLMEQIARSKQLAEENHREKVESQAQQQENLQTMRELEVQRRKELEEKLAREEKLRKERLRSEDEVLRARQASSNQKTRIADLDLQIVRSNLNKIQAAESYLQALNRITTREDSVMDLTQELEGLQNMETEIKKRDTEAEFARQLVASDLRRTIERHEKQLIESRDIRSEYDGKILELTAGEGKLVTRGLRLGTIDTRKDGDAIEAVAYFKMKDGKRIKPGMVLRLTPATVEQTRFGGLLAEVTSVSSYPLTADGAARVVGNSSVARTLTEDGHQIEVFARLLKDESGAYIWDKSTGPSQELTSGTLATALANLEERPPLTFIIPILEDWEGFSF